MDEILESLTADERAEYDRALADLLARGYVVLDDVDGLAPGARIHHQCERFPEAYTEGTATVAVVTERHGSAWSRKWLKRDVELIAIRDAHVWVARRVVGLASYHVELVEHPVGVA